MLMTWYEEDTIHPTDALQTSTGLADLAALTSLAPKEGGRGGGGGGGCPGGGGGGGGGWQALDEKFALI